MEAIAKEDNILHPEEAGENGFSVLVKQWVDHYLVALGTIDDKETGTLGHTKR